MRITRDDLDEARRTNGIPARTLAVLQRIERILERQAYTEGVITPNGIGAEYPTEELPADPETRWERYGHFTAHHSPERRETLRLVWHPGTERIFPTFDQMAEARKIWTTALSWDMSEVVGDYHVFGIPLLFDSA